MSLAYLVSQYPATSHTFIRREVAALRRIGVKVNTFSVRLPAAEDLSPDNEEEAASTFSILGQSPIRFARAHGRSLLTAPLNYLACFSEALSHRAPGLQGLVRAVAYFVEAVVLASELQRKSIRHLHVHFANSGATVGLLASKLLGISWSFVIHGPSETDYPAGYLLADKVRSADLVVCVSWFGHSQAMRLVAPDHWTKFRLVHCGIELDRLPPRAAARDTTSIICVGRLCSDKAQAGLLEAFRQVQHKHPQALLKFVGDGPDRARLERLAGELELAGKVQFLGRLPEAETLRQISGAGMMVLPSFWEGLPVALMEAMALGVPVVASRVAGIPEMIEDGENGLLFAPARWSELAECIDRLLVDEELGPRLSVAGRKTIQDEFDVQESARRLKVHFETFIETKMLVEGVKGNGERKRRDTHPEANLSI